MNEQHDESAEWQRTARAAAEELGSAVEALEDGLQAGTVSRRDAWNGLRDLQQRVSTAPAIILDDKLALLERLRAVGRRLREDQKQARQHAARWRASLTDALHLGDEALAAADSVASVQEVRADLALLRKRIESEGQSVDRQTRESVWTHWQESNQRAWQALNDRWRENEEYLRGIVDEARARVRGGDPGGARERVRAFHGAVETHECSHRALRDLRTAAAAVWSEAESAARAKRESYLRWAGQRLEGWKRTRQRLARDRVAVEAEIATLERQAAGAPTDVGAALLRGRLAERRKALDDLDIEDRKLAQQIAGAEASLPTAHEPAREDNEIG